MKALLPLMIVLAGAMPAANAYPHPGGWDGNNVKVSVSQSKLIDQNTDSASYFGRGGGWDLNNVKVSVTNGSKLLSK